MTPEELRQRTKGFGVRCIQVVDALPATRTGDVLGKQLLRAATSVGANYRAATRGRSGREFVAKLGVAIEEADECLYWLEVIIDAKLLPAKRLTELRVEGEEIVKILVATVRTMKNRTAT